MFLVDKKITFAFFLVKKRLTEKNYYFSKLSMDMFCSIHSIGIRLIDCILPHFIACRCRNNNRRKTFSSCLCALSADVGKII